MRKILKKSLCLAFTFVLTISVFFLLASDSFAVDTTWNYDFKTKTLTVGGKIVETGTGGGYRDVDGTFVQTYWHEGEEPAWYQYCQEAETIIIEDGVEEIESFAFSDFSNLRYISLPDSLRVIRQGVFYNCESIDEVTNDRSKKMQEGVLFFPDKILVLDDCISIDDIKISSLPSQIQIMSESFYGTQAYEDDNNWEYGMFYIGEYLISVPEDFSGTCTIKDGTRVVADFAFKNCEGIEEIIVPKSVKNFNSDLYFCKRLKKVTFYNYKMQSGGNYSVTNGDYNKFDNGWGLFLPDQTIVCCYKYSTAYNAMLKEYGRVLEVMGYSPDSTFVEKIRYVFWDILAFLRIKTDNYWT